MFILLFSFLSSAQACTYQLNQAQVRVGDRSISFGDYLNQKMQAKGYKLAEEGSTPEWQVSLNLKTYEQGHFEHAESTVSVLNAGDGSLFSRSADTRCYTQSCAAKDGAKVVQKSINDFGTDLPVCTE